MTKVQTVGEGDAERAIATLTLAFATDPVIRSFYPDPREHLAHSGSTFTRSHAAPRGNRPLVRGLWRQQTAVTESPDAPNENAPGLSDRGHWGKMERETGIASAVRPSRTAR